MKRFAFLCLACATAAPSFAQIAQTNAGPDRDPATTNAPQSLITLPVSGAEVTAPLVFTNGSISQPEQTELDGGGKAVFNFTITNAGNYVIDAMVNAPGEDANSFYINVDAPPEDPLMIWDMDVTSGFERRTVSWRGNGDPNNDEFTPKKFKLSAGAHKLIIVGREPAQLKDLTIRPAD